VDYYIQLAVQNNPLLKAESYKREYLKNMFLKESYLKEPAMLELGYENIPARYWPSLDQESMSMVKIQVNQWFSAPWEVAYRKSKAKNIFLSEKENFRSFQLELIRQVKDTYSFLLYLRKKIQILKKNQAVLRDIFRIIQAQVITNKASNANLFALSADISLIENQLNETDAAWEVNKGKLIILCNAKIDLRADDVNIESWHKIDWNEDFPQNIKFHSESHPLLKSLQFQIKVAQAALNLEKATLAPGVNIGVSYGFRKEVPKMMGSGESLVSIMASIPIPLSYPFKERNAISARETNLKKEKKLLEALALNINTNWDSEKAKFQKLKNSYLNYEHRVLPNLLKSYQTQLSAFSSGNGSLIEILYAYRSYLDASLDMVKLFQELRASKHQLEYLADLTSFGKVEKK
jgi:outer membrane protein TolC